MTAGAQDYLIFDLGVLEEGESSWAYGINNLNYVVGEAHVDYPTKQNSPEPGNVIDLHDDVVPVLEEDDESIARAIRNNVLQIVGANTASNKAMLWHWDGGPLWKSTVLDSTIRACGWVVRDAYDINENGWIVGWGTHNGDAHAFVLVPRDRPCPADITGPQGVPDGFVDTSDLLAVLGGWGVCAACDQCAADTDDSGAVGVSDLLAVLASWSGVRFACDGTGSVPESVEDCIEKIGYGNPVALEACIELVTGGS